MKVAARMRAHAHAAVQGRMSQYLIVMLLLVVSTAPALAGYSWCSRDPVLTFSRGLLPDHELDVQVAVQSGGVPLNDARVTLDIMVPANVTGADVLAPVTEPAFNVYTSFKPVLAAASSKSYTVFLDASFLVTDGSFDTALVITGAPLDGIELGTLQVACRGSTGKSIRAKIAFAPLAVYCQKDDVWVLAFGEGQ